MYVNGYILAVPEAEKKTYIAAAHVFAEVVKDLGALEMFENWEQEVPDGEHTDYRRAVQAKPDEKIVLAWVVWPDRETGAVAHRKLPDDPRMKKMHPLPVDGKRMIMGGFEPIVHFHRES